ncbi:SsrA-binding protein SmpB [bacterium]|nr:SsrA-binding protein SmpB [bacterium]
MTDKKNKKKRFSNDVTVENRRARFDYEIIEKHEAGIELAGSEVKSLREGGGSLTDTYAQEIGGQVFLRGLHIKPYTQANFVQSNPTRERRLLMHRKEIDRLVGQVATQGLTLVPLRLYFNQRGLAKVELALCRGKKAHDKRETIKERDLQRELRRDHKLR